MINREMLKVSVITFVKGIDKYGQRRTEIDTSKTRVIEMMIKIFSLYNINDPLYLNVELIGLTKDKELTDANQILFNDIYYNIIKIIPSGRYNLILMKKVS